jgi:stage III sporulation protein AA
MEIDKELQLLIDILPPFISSKVEKHPKVNEIIEIVMDVGRTPEIRFHNDFEIISSREIMYDDIEYVVKRIGEFGKDNRAGIPRTLHRISAIRNRHGKIVGLTCRVGRAVYGAANIIMDYIKLNKSVLILGKPGVGKTTILREVARVLNDEMKKRVVIVDTSNEIGGDGDIPHAAIGRARRMQVPSPDLQHKVMIEAVENHMPEVIIIDEMGTLEEAYAARTIAERGVQLIATAHGNTLENIIMNPTLSDLVGGIQAVILSDEEAKRRGTQKTVLERKNPPTFEILIEIRDRDVFAIHKDVAFVVDNLLRGFEIKPEIRKRDKDSYIILKEYPENSNKLDSNKLDSNKPDSNKLDLIKSKESQRLKQEFKQEENFLKNTLKVFPFAVSIDRIQRAIYNLDLPISVVLDLNEADAILTLKSKKSEIEKRVLKNPNLRNLADNIFTIRSNTFTQISKMLDKMASKDDEKNTNIDQLFKDFEQKINELYSKNLEQIEIDFKTNEEREFIIDLLKKYSLNYKELDKKIIVFRK